MGIIAALSALAPIGAWAQTQLHFSGGELTIAQFTDIHWDARSANCATTEATINAILEQEKPDLAVLSGDIVTENPAMEGWRQIAAIFAKARMPFVVLMGNHDAECATKDEIYGFLVGCPYYIGEKGPDSIAGRGNCVLPVYAPTDNGGATPEALLYMIDSGDYTADRLRLGHYDWIHFDQIAWYRHESERFARMNGGKPLPALAYFHIPLQEYGQLMGDGKTYGNANEGGVSSAKINSGMMASFLEMGDVMATFVGHDHNNDFLGISRGVLMAYGRTTGADAYGELKRGARIVRLYEGQRRLDTWIATPGHREATYYYPSGINSADEATAAYLPAVAAKPSRHGVAYKYFEGEADSVAQIGAMREVAAGEMTNFSIAEATAADHFAYTFDALLKIGERGIYRFYTYSDDGSVLYIDGERVVDNDGGHSAQRREGWAALEAGFHRLRVDYFEDYMGQELEIGIASRRIDEQPIPASMLFVEE